MATFYLVRHGQPDYSGLQERGLFGFGRDFAPLSPLGVQQAEKAAQDARLQQAELIVSSPYTRALQTAQIISLRTGIPVTVELDLHEWVPDWTNRYRTPRNPFGYRKSLHSVAVNTQQGKLENGKALPRCVSGCSVWRRSMQP